MEKTKKIGELLVEAGLVSRLQIDQALQSQHIFGGRLGTNLIEMGVIDSDTLASFLSQQFDTPRVTPEEFDSISPEVLAMVPARAAQRLCVLPIAKVGNKIAIAMLDPSNEQVRSRIETNLGLTVECRVASEIEIRYYLERHYGVPREMRHINVMNQEIERRVKGSEHVAKEQGLVELLDKEIPLSTAIEEFFKSIGSLEKIPQRDTKKDVTKSKLSPELAFILSQVDGFSTLNDILSMIPLPRIQILRGLVYLGRLGLIYFEA